MNDAGWAATRSWDGLFDLGNVPPEQDASLQDAIQACSEETRWGRFDWMDDTQLRQLYRQEVATFECLSDLGLSPEEPPTEQAYLDTFGTADQYVALMSVSGTRDQVEACPPPTMFVNIDGMMP